MKKHYYDFQITGPGGAVISRTVHANDNSPEALLSAVIGFIDSEEFRKLTTMESGGISLRLNMKKTTTEEDNDGPASVAPVG